MQLVKSMLDVEMPWPLPKRPMLVVETPLQLLKRNMQVVLTRLLSSKVREMQLTKLMLGVLML